MKKRTLKNFITSPYFAFILIFACQFVIFLAFYPGLCTYDLDNQLERFYNPPLCANHPLLHTMFIGYSITLFPTVNSGYAFASILQMIILDCSVVYGIFSFKIHKKALPYILSLLFYGIFPVNTIMAISHTKDTLFSAFAIVFFVDSYRILYSLYSGASDNHLYKNPGSHHKSHINIQKFIFFIRSIINGILLVLFRNNAKYALALTVFILLPVFALKRKKASTGFKNYLIVSILILVLSISADKAIMKATNADSGSIKEMMSIPAQIIGRIYNTTATDSEKEIILSYIEKPEIYRYYISDHIKQQLPFDVLDSKAKHFLLDSFLIAIKHPIQSFLAVWYNIQGFVDPFNCPYSSEHSFLAKNEYAGGAVLDSKLKNINRFYVDNFRTTGKYVKSPIVIILNIGLFVWLTFIGFFMSIIKDSGKDDKFHFIYIFPLAYLFTLMLGPSAIVRYAFMFYLLAPINIKLICNSLPKVYEK